MRCPRCRSNRIHDRRCQLCGASVDEPLARDPPLEGLLVDTPSPIPDDIPVDGYEVCPRCETPTGPGPVCQRCGEIVKRISPLERAKLTRGLTCLACGFENQRHFKVCGSCGSRL